jgi:hypothetical protein
MTLNHKIPCHLRALYRHNLEIFTFHCTRTQSWNQAHNHCWLRAHFRKDEVGLTGKVEVADGFCEF